MIRCTRDDCIYKGHLGENISYCNYIGHARRSRSCDPAACDKYISKGDAGREEPKNSTVAEITGENEKNNSQSEEDADDSENIPGFA